MAGHVYALVSWADWNFKEVFRQIEAHKTEADNVCSAVEDKLRALRASHLALERQTAERFSAINLKLDGLPPEASVALVPSENSTGAVAETHCYPSYSQAGEDRIALYIFNAIGHTGPIVYADIGAAYAAAHNNTYLFYTRGGRGLLVEADPAYQEEYLNVRPRDHVETLAIVPQRLRGDNVIRFYRNENRGWSTILADHASEAKANGKGDVADELMVPCAGINEVLRKHFSDNKIDLISIDIEGIESEILSDLDLERFAPTIIIVESPSARLEGRELTGYELFASTHINAIFVRIDALSTLTR